jgi:GNAT superfamily N-acetyltransferase
LSVEIAASRATQYLTKAHTRSPFCCGEDSLDRYFRERVIQDVKRKTAAAFVLTDESGAIVLGYYTLSATVIYVGDLPAEIARKLPRYPRLPATLIGRMAVSREYQGRGFGEFLLMDALARSLRNTKELGSIAVVVDAIDERARDFYLRYDFTPYQDIPKRLFLPIKTIEQLNL